MPQPIFRRVLRRLRRLRPRFPNRRGRNTTPTPGAIVPRTPNRPSTRPGTQPSAPSPAARRRRGLLRRIVGNAARGIAGRLAGAGGRRRRQ